MMTEENETEEIEQGIRETESTQELKPDLESETEPSGQKTEPATRNRRMKIIAAVAVVAVCAVIFGAGAASGLFAPNNSLMQTTQEASQQGDSSQSTPSSEQAGQEQASSSQSSQTAATDSDQAAAAANQTETAATASGADTSESAAGSDAAVASAAQSGTSAPSAAQAPASIRVSVYVDASRAKKLGYSSCMANKAVALSDGDSVYDALKATGLSVGGSSNYVRSIGGLAEFQGGSGSGWLYTVDGSRPSIGCGSYALHGGESIRWIYTLDLGNDV